MSWSDKIKQTYVTGGGLKAEQICEDIIFKPYIKAHPEWTYRDVSQDKEYQEIDVDYVFNKPGKEILYEIKGDVKSSTTGNYFIEFVTHVETISEETKKLFFDYFKTSQTISLSDFYNKFGGLIPSHNTGCNYKTKSDKTIFVPLADFGNDFVLSSTLPLLSVHSEKLKQYEFDRKDITIPKSKTNTPGLVEHSDKSENIGIAVKPSFLVRQRIGKEIKNFLAF